MMRPHINAVQLPSLVPSSQTPPPFSSPCHEVFSIVIGGATGVPLNYRVGGGLRFGGIPGGVSR